jgi:hypothetical protein
MKKYILFLLFISMSSLGQEKKIKTSSTGKEAIVLTLKNNYVYIIDNKNIKISKYASSPLNKLIIEFDGEIIKADYNFFKNIDPKLIENIIVLSSVNSIVRRIKVIKSK